MVVLYDQNETVDFLDRDLAAMTYD